MALDPARHGRAFALIANSTGICLPNSGQLLLRGHFIAHATLVTLRQDKSHWLCRRLRWPYTWPLHSNGERHRKPTRLVSQKCQRQQRSLHLNLPSYLRDHELVGGVLASNHTIGPGQVEQVDLDNRTAGCWDRYDRTNLASRQSRPYRNRVMESSGPHWLAQASHAWAAREQSSQMTDKRK
jgi:hypothetical protein